MRSDEEAMAPSSEADAQCEDTAMREDLMHAQAISLLRVWGHPDDAVWDSV